MMNRNLLLLVFCIIFCSTVYAQRGYRNLNMIKSKNSEYSVTQAWDDGSVVIITRKTKRIKCATNSPATLCTGLRVERMRIVALDGKVTRVHRRFKTGRKRNKEISVKTVHFKIVGLGSYTRRSRLLSRKQKVRFFGLDGKLVYKKKIFKRPAQGVLPTVIEMGITRLLVRKDIY
jgi:hypothetical protein